MHIVHPRLLFTRFAIAVCFLLNTSLTFADEAAAFATFDEMNTIDIETARLATERGSSDEVINLGKMIVADHEPIQQEARHIAGKLGIKSSTKGNVNGLESLKSVTGTAFDKAYMAHELPFSKDFIRRLKEEILPAITHEELKVFLQGLIPKFEEHLMHIEHTAMQLEMRTNGAGHNKAMHEKK